MATYKKRAGTNLTASINVNYDGKEIIKNLQREYQESSVLKKTISAVDLGVQIINFDTDSSFPAGSFKDCKFLLLCNEGDVTAELYYYMTEWSHASPDTVGNDGQKIHFLLHPNEYIILPNLSYIDFGTTANSAGNGATLDNAVPNVLLYENVDTDGTSEALDDSETGVDVDDIAFFELGDLIRIDDEIMEVTAITDSSGDDDDAAGTLTVVRGLYGSTAASHDLDGGDGRDIRLPFFNEYYDFDRRLHGSSQLVATDGKGRWKSRNFFGKGRLGAANDAGQGLVQGSVAIKFYESAYQEISFGGTATNIMITGSTDSKLTASTAYAFNITIDDSSAATISFTTDSSNTNFGGTNGVINKIQTAINTATQTTGNALYGMSCTVSIVNGRLRFTSNSHLAPHDGTNGSKILLEDAGSGTNLLSGSAGIFPDDAVMNAPVKAKLPDDTIIDTNSGATYPNIDAFMYDNGQGKLIYQGDEVGTVVYKTGAIEWNIPSLPNAQFVINAAYDSAFSGGIKASTANGKDNAIANIFGRSTNDKITTTIGAYVFS